MWGMLAVGLFAEKDELEQFSQHAGLFHGGGFYLLGVQALCCVCFIIWSSIVTLFLIWVSNTAEQEADDDDGGCKKMQILCGDLLQSKLLFNICPGQTFHSFWTSLPECTNFMQCRNVDGRILRLYNCEIFGQVVYM